MPSRSRNKTCGFPPPAHHRRHPAFSGDCWRALVVHGPGQRSGGGPGGTSSASPAAAAPEATNTEPKAPAGCSAQSLDTLSELEFVQTCVQEKLDSDKLLAIIQSAKEAKKCGVAQRLYANRAQGGDTKIALIYAGEYDPKYHQASECFKEADKDTAAYWYETVLQSEPENQTAKQRLEELAK